MRCSRGRSQARQYLFCRHCSKFVSASGEFSHGNDPGGIHVEIPVDENAVDVQVMAVITVKAVMSRPPKYRINLQVKAPRESGERKRPFICRSDKT